VSPNWCDTEIKCVSVSPENPDHLPCPELDEDGKTVWNFDGEDYKNVEPGTYDFTYNVCIDGLETTCEPFVVQVTLIDACHPPNSVTGEDLPDQNYIITDNMIPYTHPEFTADPAFCPVRYEYDVPKLENGNDLITRDEKDFETYYDKDLSPVGQPITVTVKAISESYWTADDPSNFNPDNR
jgi:hypothetical protein